MIVLGIETALSHCSVAICNAGEEVYCKINPAKNSQAEFIAPMIEEALLSANIKSNQIDKIAVTTGPGSFTGVRVGLAFAKAFGLAIEKPVIGISTLEALALQSDSPKTITIINMAGSVFYAAFENREIKVAPTRAEDYSFLSQFSPDFKLVGPNIQKATENFPEFANLEIEAINPFIFAAKAQFLEAIDNPPNPLYLRGADAKLWTGAKFANP